MLRPKDQTDHIKPVLESTKDIQVSGELVLGRFDG